jgi:hypothetical protein
VLDTGLRRDVLKRPVSPIPVEPVPCLASRRRVGDRSAVNEEDIDPAVVVVVEEQAT